MWTATVENARELDCVVHGCFAEFRVRYRPRIRAEAKDRCVLIREHLRECGAVGEVLTVHFFPLGVRDAKTPAGDCRHAANSGVVERVAKGIAANHAGRPHDDKTFLVRRGRVHDRPRSSTQSTKSWRSAKSHETSLFTKLSE